MTPFDADLNAASERVEKPTPHKAKPVCVRSGSATKSSRTTISPFGLCMIAYGAAIATAMTVMGGHFIPAAGLAAVGIACFTLALRGAS